MKLKCWRLACLLGMLWILSAGFGREVIACNDGCRWEWDNTCAEDCMANCGIWYELLGSDWNPLCTGWPNICRHMQCIPVYNDSGTCDPFFTCISSCNYDPVFCCSAPGCDA